MVNFNQKLDEMSMPCINLVPGVDVVDPMTDAGRFVVRSEIRRDVGPSAAASGFGTGEKTQFWIGHLRAGLLDSKPVCYLGK